MKHLRIVATGYAVAALFLLTFLLANAFGRRIGLGDHNPSWALLVAAAVVLPLLLPVLVRDILPHVSGLKIPNMIEVSFAKAEVASNSLAGLVESLPVVAGEVMASEYASMMTSMSVVIVEAIEGIRITGDPVIIVNLGDGKKWIPPNLFILAVLARDHTAVRLIAFVETQRTEDTFVGMCAPRDLIAGLGEHLPLLNQALSQSLAPGNAPSQVATLFFSALSALYNPAFAAPPVNPGQSAAPQSVKDLWLNGPRLLNLLGARIYSDQIEWHEPLPAESARQVMRAQHPYIAAIASGQLQFIIDRDRFSLLVLRQLVAS